MSYIGQALERRVISTLKINPTMTYNEAIESVLQSEGLILATESKTVITRMQRSAMAKQSANQQAGE